MPECGEALDGGVPQTGGLCPLFSCAEVTPRVLAALWRYLSYLSAADGSAKIATDVTHRQLK